MKPNLEMLSATVQKSFPRELTKSDSLTADLIELVVSGELPQGRKISEPGLAKQFQVSRGPLREALLRLEGLGLIERSPRIGARVIRLDLETLRELYSVREALEGMAARLAARNITNEQLNDIESLLALHQQHIEQVSGASYFNQQDDFDFHYRLIQASGNQRLVQLLCGELYHQLRMYRYQSPSSDSRPNQALKQHFAIFEAVRHGDEELAEILMRRHISGSRQLLEAQWAATPEPTEVNDEANTRS